MYLTSLKNHSNDLPTTPTLHSRYFSYPSRPSKECCLRKAVDAHSH